MWSCWTVSQLSGLHLGSWRPWAILFYCGWRSLLMLSTASSNGSHYRNEFFACLDTPHKTMDWFLELICSHKAASLYNCSGVWELTAEATVCLRGIQMIIHLWYTWRNKTFSLLPLHSFCRIWKSKVPGFFLINLIEMWVWVAVATPQDSQAGLIMPYCILLIVLNQIKAEVWKWVPS